MKKMRLIGTGMKPIKSMTLNISIQQNQEYTMGVFRAKNRNLYPAIQLWNNKGFSLIELMIIIAILGVLSAVGIPNYLKYKERAMIVSAISEIRIIDRAIAAYEIDTGNFPASLSEIKSEFIDPWGNPYQYLNIRDSETKGKGKDDDTKGKGNNKDEKGKGNEGSPGKKDKMRKDHFMVPVNSDYDLYSMGKDGKSVAPFTAKASRDDIVRANNGMFFGLASDF